MLIWKKRRGMNKVEQEVSKKPLSWRTQSLGSRFFGKTPGPFSPISSVLVSQLVSLLKKGCPNITTSNPVIYKSHSVPQHTPLLCPHCGSLEHRLQLHRDQ